MRKQVKAIIQAMSLDEVKAEFKHNGYDAEKMTHGETIKSARNELLWALDDYDLFQDFLARHSK